MLVHYDHKRKRTSQPRRRLVREAVATNVRNALFLVALRNVPGLSGEEVYPPARHEGQGGEWWLRR